MNRIAQADAALRAGEAKLRELIADAAKAGAYDEVAQLTELVRQVSALLQPQSDERTTEVSTLLPAGVASRKLARRYPYFLRRNDDLLKVGWSKKAKKEYRQAVPHPAVEAVVAKLAKLGSDKKLLAVESLQPVTDAGGREVPIYEIYNCIAWLRTHGLIRKHGQKGYRIASSVSFVNDVQDAWRKLPEGK